MRRHLPYLAPARFAGSWGTELSPQPTPTSPCSIDLPPELGLGLGVTGVNTLLDLCWFSTLQSQGHEPSERVVFFCLFFISISILPPSSPNPSPESLHPRDPPAGSRRQLILVPPEAFL